GTTYTVPASTGIYAGVRIWIIRASDDTTLIGNSVTSGGSLDSSSGTYFNLSPAGGVFYYQSPALLASTPESPLYIDQTTVNGNNNVYQVVATSANRSSWLVNSQSGGIPNIVGVQVNVGDTVTLPGATSESGYYLVFPGTPPPSNSVRFTFYANIGYAEIGGVNGNTPRLNTSVVTNNTVPASTGNYAGVTSWIIQQTNDTSGSYSVGQTVSSLQLLSQANGTYYNLTPNGGVYYYNSLSDANDPVLTENPLYIDQSKRTDSGGTAYQVLGVTSPPQEAWIVAQTRNGNASLQDKIVLTTELGLSGANTFAYYYLIKITRSLNVRITLYASHTNAQNGGPNGNEPRLAQINDAPFTGQIFISILNGVSNVVNVTKWTIESTDDTDFAIGDVVTISERYQRINSTATYYNLVPYGGMFYYNTASGITNSPETPIYIDQSLILGDFEKYKLVATSANQTSWLVNSQLRGNPSLVGQTIAVGSSSFVGAYSVPPANYYLVKVPGVRPPCFLEGSSILTDTGYVPIETIRPGILIQTNLDGLKKVEFIGYSSIYNPSSTDRLKNRLYVCKKENYPELTEDLVLTGDHSILVDEITDKERELMVESLGRIFVTSNKYRLTAQADERATPYQLEGTFNVWHLALENELDNTNYGIYANGGLLVESAPIKALKGKENVTLV
ncbi:MAG: hypothetical protein EB127_04305, partial [Alphaproteobacteria bacterium]|nr:hypothetical protein [Alphaproteobacteria bacterium]